MKKIQLLFFATAFLIMACENEIKFTGETVEPLLVMNAFVCPDSTIKVSLSESVFFLDEVDEEYSFTSVTDAKVKLYVNEQEMETLTYQNIDINDIGVSRYRARLSGYYVSTYQPRAGDKLRLTASSPKFSEVYSDCVIPNPVSISSVETIKHISVKQPIIDIPFGGTSNSQDTIGYYTNDLFSLKINFEDKADERNFYRINFQTRNYYKDGSVTTNNLDYSWEMQQSTSDYMYSYSGFCTTDKVFDTGQQFENELFDISNLSPYFEFSDELFNGKEYGLNVDIGLSASLYNQNYGEEDQHDLDSSIITKREIIINLYSISKEYYLYLKTFQASENEMPLFSEPTMIYSNVNGGIGIIGAYSVNQYVLEVK